MTWDQTMLQRIESPANWSRARRVAEQEWARVTKLNFLEIKKPKVPAAVIAAAERRAA